MLETDRERSNKCASMNKGRGMDLQRQRWRERPRTGVVATAETQGRPTRVVAAGLVRQACGTRQQRSQKNQGMRHSSNRK